MDILLFPASTVLVSFAALGAAQAVSQVEVRLSLQALFIVLGVKDIFFGASLFNYFTLEKPQETHELPQISEPPILMDGLPLRKITPITDQKYNADITQLRAPAQKAMQEGIKDGQKIDTRIQAWAEGVAYWNAPMTQTRWCVGKNKTFSKPAYVAFMADLLKDRIVVPKNINSNSSTYEANGGAGRAYIKALADRKVYRPFPTYEVSNSSTAFLRAQTKKHAAEGEGAGETR